MDGQRLKRLRYLRQNYKFLTAADLSELDELEIQFANEQAYRDQSDAVQTKKPDLSRSQMLTEKYYEENEEDAYYEDLDDLAAEIEQAKKKKPFFKKDKSNKKKGKKKRRFFRKFFIFLLVLLLAMSGFFVYGYGKGWKKAGGFIQAAEFNGQDTESGAVNILLIGADQRPDQTTAVSHSDSMMILQLNPQDGKIKIVSLMRDTLVYVPGYSEAGQADLKINTAYTLGEQNGARQGAELLRQTIEQNFGVPCKYYALVDFASFSTIIDSLFPAGVQIDAQFGTIYGKEVTEVPVPDDLAKTEGLVDSDRVLTAEEAVELGFRNRGGTFMMIKEGEQRMDGRTLLNYARFRYDDDNDFGRVKRQQQVLAAVMSQLKNPLTLFTGSSALGTARALTETNVPTSFMLLQGPSTVWDMKNGTSKFTIPDVSQLDYEEGYDQYGGLGLEIDFEVYTERVQNFLGK